MERFIPMEIFQKKVTPFEVLTSSRHFAETTEIFWTIYLVNQCQASSWGGMWLIVLTQAHSLFGVLQMIQL